MLKKILVTAFCLALLAGCSQSTKELMFGKRNSDKSITEIATNFAGNIKLSPFKEESSLAESKERVGKPIFPGSSIKIENIRLSFWTVYYILNTGEEVLVEDFNKRVFFVDNYIHQKKDIAFNFTKNTDLGFDRKNGVWWIKTKNNYSSPVKFYIGKNDEEKWIRIITTYSGKSPIFYDQYSVVSNGEEYSSGKLPYHQGRRDAETQTGTTIQEQYDLMGGASATKLIKPLLLHGGEIKFHGREQNVVKTIDLKEFKENTQLMALFNLMPGEVPSQSQKYHSPF